KMLALLAQTSSGSSAGSTILGWVIAIVVILAIVGKLSENAKKSGGKGLTKGKISVAGRQSDGTLRCPHCGGQQFAAKRSAAAKAVLVPTVGVGTLLAPKSQVK